LTKKPEDHDNDNAKLHIALRIQ